MSHVIAFTFDLIWQVTRTGIKSRTSSNFARICPLTSELPVLECRKKCCGHDSAFSFDQIFFKLADNEDSHKISDEFDFRPDRTIRFGVTWASKFFP